MPPEPARRLPVPGTWGYADSLGVKPGQAARFHVSAPAAYQFSLVRLGRRAILQPGADTTADRSDVELLTQRFHESAEPRTISPGSYVYVEGPAIPNGPLTLCAWLRPWRLPTIDAVQWAWQGIIADLDYPDACRFGLILDHAGRIGVYTGDGGLFRHAWLHLADIRLGRRLGEWLHLAAGIGESDVALFADGQLVYRGARAAPPSEPGPAARLRLGATGEAGAAANFLDGDIAAPFVGAFTLDETAARRLAADRGRTDPAALGLGAFHGLWPLDEERGATVRDRSGSGRTGRLVNHPAWQVGGPAHDPSRGAPGYDPASDPDRGHGLRLASDDLVDCYWPVTDEWRVPDSAPSGLYAGRVCLVGQDPDTALAIPFAVVRTEPRQADSVALLLATNTWLAYGRRPTNELPIAGLSASFYSCHQNGRPFFYVGGHAPIPRANPYGFESERAARQQHAHLVRPERYAEAWLEQQGYPYELLTDADLDADPDSLAAFRVLLIAGHNEYWTDRMRAGVDRFLGNGGRVLSLSGNTLCWRTTFDEERTILEARKAVDSDDARWLSPRRWGERWHELDGAPGGAWPMLGRPAFETLGLETQGMVDDGTPTSFASFTVLRPDHALFHEPEEVPLTPAGTLGERNLNGPRASGYEFDAAPDTVGLVDRPLPGQVVLASALGQRNIESYSLSQDHGADIVYWQRPAGGEVVNAGSIGVTGALAVDPGVAALVRNALAHFGVPRGRGGAPS